MRFDVAISYASEQHREAEAIARCLTSRGYVVYFAPDMQHLMIGEPLGITLAKIYEHESRCCAVIVSRDYAEKEDPQWELAAAVSRHKHQRGGYILPFRVDDTVLLGLPSDTVYKNLWEIKPVGACELIAKRLGPSLNASADLDGFTTDRPTRSAPALSVSDMEHLRPERLMIVLQKDVRTGPVFNLDFVLANPAAEPVTLHRVQGRLTDPNGTSCPLRWRVFYSTGDRMFPTDDSLPMSLSPDSERNLGMQLVGPASIADYVWPIGVFELGLEGWLDDLSEPAAASSFRLAFSFEITAMEANGLAYWRDASERDWELLNDPHNAVGIPLRIGDRDQRR